MTAFESQDNHPLRQLETREEEGGEWRGVGDGWIDEEQDGKKGREHQLFGRLFLPRFAEAGWTGGSTIDSITRQTLQGYYTTTHRGPCSSQAGCWFFFFLPLFSLPVNVCPSSGAPGRHRNSSPQLDSNLFSCWMIPLSVLHEEPEGEREWRGRRRAGSSLFVRLYIW